MELLAQEQTGTFWRDGVLVIGGVIGADELAALQAEFANWGNENCAHDGEYREAPNGRSWFDPQPDHTAETLSIRKIQPPEGDIITCYAEDALERSPNHLSNTSTHKLVHSEVSVSIHDGTACCAEDTFMYCTTGRRRFGWRTNALSIS